MFIGRYLCLFLLAAAHNSGIQVSTSKTVRTAVRKCKKT